MIEAAFGGPEEAVLVARLHADGDVVLSLAAEQEGRIVGHVLFSRLQAPVRALALAPVAVIPDRQGCGIGSALIRAGLARAADAGWQAVFVLGDPDYYSRFGFATGPAGGFASPYASPHFMALALASDLPVRSGEIGYPDAFAAL